MVMMITCHKHNTQNGYRVSCVSYGLKQDCVILPLFNGFINLKTKKRQYGAHFFKIMPFGSANGDNHEIPRQMHFSPKNLPRVGSHLVQGSLSGAAVVMDQIQGPHPGFKGNLRRLLRR